MGIASIESNTPGVKPGVFNAMFGPKRLPVAGRKLAQAQRVQLDKAGGVFLIVGTPVVLEGYQLV